MSARRKRSVLPALAAGALALLIGSGGAQERKFVPSPLKLFGKALDNVRQGKPAAVARKPGAVRRQTRDAAAPAALASPAAPRLPHPRPDPKEAASEAVEPTATVEAADPLEPRFDVSASIPAPPRLEDSDLTVLSASDLASLAPPPPALPVPIHIEQEWENAGFDRPPAENLELAATVPDDAATASAIGALDGFARTPRARPQAGTALLAMVDPRGEGEPQPSGSPQPPTITQPADPACLGRLRALGVQFTQEPATGEGACLVAHPLSVTTIGSGMRIEPEAIMNCPTAEALALWARDSVVPAARDMLKATPTKFAHGSTYVCRSRYNRPGEKMSEHALANAVDIMSVGFADRDLVSIGAPGAGKAERAFEAAIREGSCSYFTTVLGPGSNAAHATHFHLDLAKRRGGHRLCELGEEKRTAERPDKAESE